MQWDVPFIVPTVREVTFRGLDWREPQMSDVVTAVLRTLATRMRDNPDHSFLVTQKRLQGVAMRAGCGDTGQRAEAAGGLPRGSCEQDGSGGQTGHV